jgi:Lrp/AsnC family transcriptional regulator, leucine-responsive regulatory protein
MKIKLTLHDKKILRLLTEDARLSDSEIAKKIGISRERARYRINRLVELKVISGFVVVCNLEKLGYSTYHLFISLRNAGKTREEEMIKTIAGIETVNYIATMIGEYDFLIECNARNALELNEIIRAINNNYRNNISKLHINIVFQECAFPHNYLYSMKDSMKESGKEISFPRHSESIIEEIDETDKKILVLLSSNARRTSTEIARKIGVSVDKVIYRIKQMEKKGIIQGYKALINIINIGLQRHIILFKIQATEKQELAIVEDLRQRKEILYLMRCVGEWNLVVDMCFKDITELREMIQDIRSKHSEIIKEDTVLIEFQEHKNGYFPTVAQA